MGEYADRTPQSSGGESPAGKERGLLTAAGQREERRPGG
jgi:hypothetical protein